MQLKQLRSISGKSLSLGLIVSMGVLGINVERATAQLRLSNESADY